jgi:hypothetical protein
MNASECSFGPDADAIGLLEAEVARLLRFAVGMHARRCARRSSQMPTCGPTSGD